MGTVMLLVSLCPRIFFLCEHLPRDAAFHILTSNVPALSYLLHIYIFSHSIILIQFTTTIFFWLQISLIWVMNINILLK